jgi:hypothetical protein
MPVKTFFAQGSGRLLTYVQICCFSLFDTFAETLQNFLRNLKNFLMLALKQVGLINYFLWQKLAGNIARLKNDKTFSKVPGERV